VKYFSLAMVKMNSGFSFSQENDLVFCNEVCCDIYALGHQHDLTEWRMFIDFSNFILKAVLLRNGNKFPSMPLAHAANTQ
jgi:hypothetical protein